MPWAATPGPVEFGAVYAAVVVLSGVVAGPRVADGIRLAVRADGRSAEADVEWPDGAVDRVRLDPP